MENNNNAAMKLTAIVLLIAIALVFAGGYAYLQLFNENNTPPVTDDTPDDTPEDEFAFTHDLIRLNEIAPGDLITSPLLINGEARGPMYYEAEFLIILLDGNDKPIGQGSAVAIGEWMTEEFVPFSTTIVFTAPQNETGTLVLEKANASGLPEHDEKIRVPVRFK